MLVLLVISPFPTETAFGRSGISGLEITHGVRTPFESILPSADIGVAFWLFVVVRLVFWLQIALFLSYYGYRIGTFR